MKGQNGTDFLHETNKIYLQINKSNQKRKRKEQRQPDNLEGIGFLWTFVSKPMINLSW